MFSIFIAIFDVATLELDVLMINLVIFVFRIFKGTWDHLPKGGVTVVCAYNMYMYSFGYIYMTKIQIKAFARN